MLDRKMWLIRTIPEEVSESAKKCKVPKSPKCVAEITHAEGSTTVSCTFVMRGLKSDRSRHREPDCGQDHGDINQKCRANIASAGTPNERGWCDFQPAPQPVDILCVEEGTSLPIVVDASLNDSITR